MKAKVVVFVLSVVLSSCLGTKYLKKDQSLLVKQQIKSEGEISADELNGQLSQHPNSRPMQLPIAHLVHLRRLGLSMFDTAQLESKQQRIEKKFNKKIARAKSSKRKATLNSKKIQKLERIERKLKEGNQLMRWGEKLAVFDSSKVKASATNLKQYLFTKGYFNGHVEAEVNRKSDKKVKTTYIVHEGKPYEVDSMIYVIKDPKLDTLFKDNLEEQLLIGEQYDQSLFTQERDRVYDLMTNHGYYNFKRQYVLFEVDSTILDDHRLVVRETIANPPGKSGHRTHRLDSVIFTTGSNEGRFRRVTTHNDITFNFSKNKYPERLLSWRVFLEKDSLYSKKLTLETQKQLSYLDIFKFVNINYDSTGGKFIANIFTSPLKKYQTSTEVGLSVFDEANGLPGPFFNFNAKSRNIFGGLEIFQFDGTASIQGISSVSEEENNYSRLQYGGQLSVTFPQFLFPLKESKRSAIGRYNPRTKVATGVNFEDRRGEYERTTFNGSMSYIWQVRDNSQFSFKPFDLSYIKSNNSQSFSDRLDSLARQGNQSLVSAFESSFVSFSAFTASFNKNKYGVGNVNSMLLQGYLETGGNLNNLTKDNIFGDSLEYYKYIKASIEFRQNHRLTSKSALAYRFHVGAAYAYGTNRALPYEKYFFAGGSNSIRAWRPRRLGPGAYAPYDASVENESKPNIDYTREQPGDIILETSVEYRADLVGFVDYALFVDAGNTWLWRSQNVSSASDGDSNDNGVFKFSEFPQEIAVGAGFGLRMDFSFLILRLDLAYKMVDPAYPKGERFLLDDYKLKYLWDFNNYGAFNIGIGYPF
ncbi:translocation and assembly module lipoprotein TamL [Marinoscillum furvescens]|uniref:Outer membrane protein assembly factor BamA n=1 Tax=Marinoscillum furvescens DSM 4134 TaxID=1122208 RepID=A0A3D9KZ99_MARFU|nr:BamA/TamA family outer membrane protein [Marinoscillum furvescens]RED95619.1 outer membrane protein assembly factor BamA [Marinoscillum furvescens DSM 4134]